MDLELGEGVLVEKEFCPEGREKSERDLQSNFNVA